MIMDDSDSTETVFQEDPIVPSYSLRNSPQSPAYTPGYSPASPAHITSPVQLPPDADCIALSIDSDDELSLSSDHSCQHSDDSDPWCHVYDQDWLQLDVDSGKSAPETTQSTCGAVGPAVTAQSQHDRDQNVTSLNLDRSLNQSLTSSCEQNLSSSSFVNPGLTSAVNQSVTSPSNWTSSLDRPCRDLGNDKSDNTAEKAFISALPILTGLTDKKDSHPSASSFHRLKLSAEPTRSNTGSFSASELHASSVSDATITDLRDRLSRKNTGDLRDKLSRRRTISQSENVSGRQDTYQELKASSTFKSERVVVIETESSVLSLSDLEEGQNGERTGTSDCSSSHSFSEHASNIKLEELVIKTEVSSAFQERRGQAASSRNVEDFLREERHKLACENSDICQEGTDKPDNYSVHEPCSSIKSFDLNKHMAERTHRYDYYRRSSSWQDESRSSGKKRKSESFLFRSDHGKRDTCKPQDPKKRKLSRSWRSREGMDRHEEHGHAAAGHVERGEAASRLTSKRRHHEQTEDPLEKFLSSCSKKPPEEWNPDSLCIFLAQNQIPLQQALMEYRTENREISDRLIALLHSALTESSRLCENSRRQMMNMLKQCAFFESKTIINFVKSLVPTRYHNPDDSDTAVADHLLNIMKKLSESHVLFKEDMVVFLGSLQAALRTVRIVLKGEDVTVALMKKARSIEQEPEKPQAPETSVYNTSDWDKTEDDFLDPILPDIGDIRRNRRSHLAPRSVADPFSSATEYVRYIFLSFREDFVGPLCKGICDYIKYAYHQKNSPEKKHKFWNQDVRLYENVRVLDTALSNDAGIDVTIQIDVSRLRNFTSRLVYGSLVCLSCDQFQSVIYAVVSNRNMETLRGQGILSIHLLDIQRGENQPEEVTVGSHGLEGTGSKRQERPSRGDRSDTCPEKSESVQRVVDFLQGQSITMLESSAFYTAYVHSLQSLKTLHARLATRQSSLPFKKQLLHMSKDMSAPRYLEASSGRISFMCMKKYSPDPTKHLERQLRQLERDTDHVLQDVSQIPDTKTGSDESVKELMDHASKLSQEIDRQKKLLKEKLLSKNVSEPATWPSASELGLDGSQYAALRLALTHEVVLIQGPPGTGKTTLGIRIAELLLENEHLWRKDDHGLMEERPLLLLSYTNHALDQFLTELLRLPVLSGEPYDSVVRVGSRSEQAMLVDHNITKLRQAVTMDITELRNEKRVLDMYKDSRILLDNQIASLKEGIVNHERFHTKGVMEDSHYQSLVGKKQKKMDVILEWLCLDEDDFGHSLNHSKSYVHGRSLEKKSRKKRKESFQKDSEQHQGRDGSWTGDDVPGCSETRSMRQDTVPDGSRERDVNEPPQDREGVDPEVSHECLEEGELADCEQEMDLEVERERRLYLDDSSDEGDESARTERPSTSRHNSDDTLQQESDIACLLALCKKGRVMLISLSGSHTFPDEMRQNFLPSFLERIASKIQQEVNDGDIMEDEEATVVSDVWRLDVKQRWRLYRLWLRRLLLPLRNQRLAEEDLFKDTSRRTEEIRRLTDLHIMRNARVVAMTTTGAARYGAVLNELGPRIVLVEEAAQVPEAHLLSSLSPACQHLIMIGDHQQLRPSYTNYDLTVRHHRHHIDISLFERLCRANVPYQRLALQHRMRPEISSLLVPTIYSELKDDASVHAYPEVRGVKHNVFFLTHSQPEDAVEESRSKRNTHEAQFVARLYLYLRLQGYTEKDITVLALYKDQVLLLRTLIKQMEKDPRLPEPQSFCEEKLYRVGRPNRPAPRPTGACVTAVDNFQGEENRIILLSLVRSNSKGRIGYLREDNRVCVALSRAKEGFFVVGNCGMLSEASPDCWKPILEKAEKSGWLGEALSLHCPEHDRTTPVSCGADIATKCKNGGCSERCDYRLECGHTCDEVCHSPDLFHDCPCKKRCALRCPSEHPCRGLCSERPCPPCQERCERKCLFGHPCLGKCGEECPPCREQCERKLLCGHRCQARCGLPCTRECQELEKVQGVCGHEFQEACHQVQRGAASCRVPCGAVLECGHLCPGKCGLCFAGRLHVACAQPCRRVFVCRHECQARCTQSCPPCGRACEAKCVHSKKSCNKECGEECQRCVEDCPWKCKSKCRNKYRCRKRCWEMCERPRCDRPCVFLHTCESCEKAYKCRGLRCEDRCPPACPTCNADIFDTFFGDEGEPDARFYKMPDCPCVLEVGALDRYMDMAVSSEDECRTVGPVVCPKCSSPVVTALRYGNVLKKAQADVDQVKRRVLAADPQQVRAKQCQLQGRLALLGGDDLQAWKTRMTRTITEARTLEELTVPENQINFLAAVFRLAEKLPLKGSTPENRKLSQKLQRYLESLEKWIKNRQTQLFSQQQLTEFQAELARADLAVAFCIADNQVNSIHKEDEKAEVGETTQKCLRRLLSDPKVLSPEEEAEMRKSVEALQKRCSSSLGISNEERIMIVKAMGFQKGHWYTCKNGHVYCISECGGAMQESQCPDCGEGIGGRSHRLRADNAVATQMDGATYGAWSEQANLANYQLD